MNCMRVGAARPEDRLAQSYVSDKTERDTYYSVMDVRGGRIVEK